MTDLSTEIAQLPTVTSVAPSDWLVIQPGTGGTPLRKASAEQVMNGLIDAIGTGTIVANDVIITGGTATLDVGSITSLTAGTIDIKSGTGTLATGSINTLTVSGTATVGLGAFTKLNAGTVDIDNGDALLQTATITSLNAGTIVGTTATLTSLNAGTVTITTGTGTLTALTVTGTLGAGTANLTTANIGTVDIDAGAAVLQSLQSDAGTITNLTAPTLAVSGTATVGHVSATSVTAAGAIIGASGTITSINAGTVAVSGKVTAATGTITDVTATTLAATGTATIGHAAATSATVGTLVASAGTVTLASATVTDAVVSKGTIATLIANAGTVSLSKGTITDLASTTLAATGVATIGTLIANAGTVTLGKGTITDLAATTLSASGTATIGHLAGTTGTIATGTIGTLTANAGTVTLGKATVTDAVVTTGTVGTLVSTVGTITAVNAGTITSSGAVTGASGTFTTGSIPTLAVSGTATVGTAITGGATAATADARWGLFGAVDVDSTGAAVGWSEADGTHSFGQVKTPDLIATKSTITTAVMDSATATVVTAGTVSVSSNNTYAGDQRWGLFGALDVDATSQPFGFKAIDGVYVFGSVRTGTLTLNSEPTASDHAATKKYVDEASGGTSGAYTGIELEARDAQALAQSMAVRSQTNPTIATPCWTYSHIIHYGQSFALGFGSAGLISTTAGPDGTFSFGSRPANTVATDVFTQSGSATMLDLTITAGAEVPAIGMVNYLRRSQLARANLASDSTRQLVVNAAGKGGTALADLSKGATPTEYYGQLTDLMAKAHTAAGGSSYGIAGLCLLQGEQDYAAGTSEASYKATLETFATDFATDAKAEAVQTPDPGLFLCQTSSDWDSGSDISAIGNAQLSAAQDNPNIYLIGPYYAYPDDGTKHLTSDGYRWVGEQFAKVFDRVVFAGEGWLPCHITAAWFRGDKVLLEYHTPEPPLQVQAAYLETTPTTFANRGFRLGDDAGSITISAIEVKKSSIVITMARETSTAANPWVQYAGNATYDGAGNICDSDPAISYATDSVSGDPYPLWNWAVGQRMTIVEDV